MDQETSNLDVGLSGFDIICIGCAEWLVIQLNAAHARGEVPWMCGAARSS